MAPLDSPRFDGKVYGITTQGGRYEHRPPERKHRTIFTPAPLKPLHQWRLRDIGTCI